MHQCRRQHHCRVTVLLLPPVVLHLVWSAANGTGLHAIERLHSNVFPHAMATGYIHNGTMAGKLNGVIPAATPTG